MKQYNWEQDQIAHMKNYIARFGHGSAKLARQAQSKEKTLAKMVAGGNFNTLILIGHWLNNIIITSDWMTQYIIF